MNMETDNITKINKVIEKYFQDNLPVDSTPAKDLISIFIKAEIFSKDHRGGLPIGKILRVTYVFKLI